MKRKSYWIQKTGVKKHKGALHRQLSVPIGNKIPKHFLTDISKAKIGTKVRGHKVTHLLKRRAVLAETFRRYK